MRAYTHRVEENTWWPYVLQVAGKDSARDIASKMGGRVHHSAVARWKNKPPTAENAASFARAYGRPVKEALVAQGTMTAAEAGDQIADLDDEVMLLEQLRRVRERKAGSAER